jgi:hypothetical protein
VTSVISQFLLRSSTRDSSASMTGFRRLSEALLTLYAGTAVLIITALILLPNPWAHWLSGHRLAEDAPFNHTKSLQNLGALPSLDGSVTWPEYPLMKSLGISSGGQISAHTLLSKAFSDALKPSSITPFYYQSSYSRTFQANQRRRKHNPLDITITTLVTPDRFTVLAQLAEKYRGPISATVHVPVPSDIPPRNSTVEQALSNLHRLYTSYPYLAAYVDIHLVLSPLKHSREFNLWRNIARYFALTPFVMMLDVDFVVCTDFRSRILLALQDGGDSSGKERSTMLQRLQDGRAALVVPAFEYTNHEEGKNVSSFPRNKQVCSYLRVFPPMQVYAC